MSLGKCYRLPTSARYTSENGCGSSAFTGPLWPTPAASDHRNRGTFFDPCIHRRVKSGAQITLSMVAQGGHPELVKMIRENVIPTPTSSWVHGITSKSDVLKIRKMVDENKISYATGLVLTSGQVHRKDEPPWRVDEHKAWIEKHGRQYSGQALGTINPKWVEWLMGWPIGWTDLRPLGTVGFRSWVTLHGFD